MDVQQLRPTASVRGVFRTVALQDNRASGQQQAQHRQSHMYTIIGSIPRPTGLSSRGAILTGSLPV
eukprot:3222545-Prorocentrum_lima.AAC.1